MTAPWVRVGLSCLLGLGVALGATAAKAVPLVVDGTLTNTCPDGGVVITGGCRYGGTHTFDSITLKNGAIVEVVTYPTAAGNKDTQGNLVFKTAGNINIDATSRITARGRGY